MGKQSAAEALVEIGLDFRQRLADVDAMIEDCPLRGKWRGCWFQPRYDTSAADLRSIPEDDRSDALEDEGILNAFKSSVYICDVCVRCGRTTRLPNKPTT